MKKQIKIIFKIIAGVIITLTMLFIIYELTWIWWTSSENFINKPDSSTLATAEYLYKNPKDIPNNIVINWIKNPLDRNLVCVSRINIIGVGPYRWSRLFLNGGLVPLKFIYSPLWLGTDATNQFNQNAIFCLNPDEENLLPEGFHLLKIEFRMSPFNIETTYEWAIKIEPSPTPSPTPPAP